MSATPKPPSQADVVIVGGGLIGVSIAYHLAQRGVQATVLERKQLACGTTWHAAGIVGQLRESSAQTELAKYTAGLFDRLERETGQATGYKQNGTLNLALSPLRHEQLKRTADHAGRMGVPATLLGREAILEKWPGLKIDDVHGGLYVPSNGQVNALDATHALAKGARSLGAQIVENCPAQALVIQDRKVQGVQTADEMISAKTVVLATGIWSAQFAAQHGITVPLHAVEHWYVVTEPLQDLEPSRTILNIAEERTYWKEDAGKLLIGGFEAQGKPWGTAGISPEFCFDEIPFDLAHSEPLLTAMFERYPPLQDLGIQTYFNGPESFTPDGRPYLGPVREVEGLMLATGMNSNGVLNSGGVGLTLAEWIVDGAPARPMDALAAHRIQAFQSSPAYRAARAAESLGFHYGLQWPGRQITSARGLRRLPLHAQWVARGACFAERAGWEVPQYFDASHRGWPYRESIGYQDWAPQVKAECLTAHTRAVLLDQSMYAKIQVEGRDACCALNAISAAQCDVPVGRSVYGHFLNDRGGCEADVTLLRLRQDQFLIISGHPSQGRDLHWIQRHLDPKWRVHVTDMTSGLGLLSIHGPDSRAHLQALSRSDLSAAALGFGDVRDIDLGQVRATVIRRSFLGELGFELLFPTEFAGYIFDQLAAVPSLGMFALNACRLEKGFRHYGHDFDSGDTPFDVGLGFAVDLSKPSFKGRDALLARPNPGPVRTVLLSCPSLVEQRGPYLIHNEPVFRGDALIGHVTSGGWGHRTGLMLGLANVQNRAGVTQAWLAAEPLHVLVAGQRVPAVPIHKAAYDPEGHKMRG